MISTDQTTYRGDGHVERTAGRQRASLGIKATASASSAHCANWARSVYRWLTVLANLIHRLGDMAGTVLDGLRPPPEGAFSPVVPPAHPRAVPDVLSDVFSSDIFSDLFADFLSGASDQFPFQPSPSARKRSSQANSVAPDDAKAKRQANGTAMVLSLDISACGAFGDRKQGEAVGVDAGSLKTANTKHHPAISDLNAMGLETDALRSGTSSGNILRLRLTDP